MSTIMMESSSDVQDLAEDDAASISVSARNEIKPIEQNVIHRICSGQVIVTLSTAVKELVENSIDAGATSIEIRLAEHGSKLIEVIDNGIGVEESNFEGLGLKHHTSKISEFEDLTSIATFGFRGEALSSLCALATLTITTRSEEARQGFRIEYDAKGRISSKIPCARSRGTTVSLKNLFSPLPVRHKEFLKHIKREFNKMISVLYGYCFIAKGVRISCTNQVERGAPVLLFSVPASPTMRERIASIFGAKQLNTLIEIEPIEVVDNSTLEHYGLDAKTFDIGRFRLDGFISQPNSGRSCGDRQFFFINSRPCEPVKIARLVNEVFHSFSRSQYPFICLHIQTKQESVDVNVTPDKRMVYLQNEKMLFATIKATLLSCLMKSSSSFDTSCSQSSLSFVSSQSSPPSSSNNTKIPEVKPVSVPGSRRPCSFRTGNDATGSEDIRNPNAFAPQFSGRPQEAGGTRDIRSVLKRFSVGNSSISSPNPNPSGPSQQSSNTSIPNKRPTLSSFKKGATKQPKLMEFLRSRSKPKKFAHGDQREDDDDVTILEEEDVVVCEPEEGTPAMDNSPAESTAALIDESELLEIPNSSDEENVVDPGWTLTEVSFDDNDPGTEQEDSDTETKVETSQSHPKTSFRVDWNDVKARLLAGETTTDSESEIERSARKFRAQISPTDNKTAENELRKQLSKEMFSEMEILGQFNLGFIITKHGPDLFIVDQHASDEKYTFEELQKWTILQGQRLIAPLPLQLPAPSENIIIENLTTFQKNGFYFDINPAGEPTKRVSLTKIPYSKSCEFGKQDIEELIFMLEDAPEKTFCRSSKVRAMFASRACRKSVMIGTTLSRKDMKRVVCQMGLIEQPWNCPHGRPTIRHLLNLNLLPDSSRSVTFNH